MIVHRCCANVLCPAVAATTTAPPLKFQRCTRCRCVVYCGVMCQRAHWAHHRSACYTAAHLGPRLVRLPLAVLDRITAHFLTLADFAAVLQTGRSVNTALATRSRARPLAIVISDLVFAAGLQRYEALRAPVHKLRVTARTPWNAKSSFDVDVVRRYLLPVARLRALRLDRGVPCAGLTHLLPPVLRGTLTALDVTGDQVPHVDDLYHLARSGAPLKRLVLRGVGSTNRQTEDHRQRWPAAFVAMAYAFPHLVYLYLSSPSDHRNDDLTPDFLRDHRNVDLTADFARAVMDTMEALRCLQIPCPDEETHSMLVLWAEARCRCCRTLCSDQASVRHRHVDRVWHCACGRNDGVRLCMLNSV